MAGKFVLTIRDYGTKPETSTATFRGATFTAGNIAAQLADQNTLETALDGIILGVIANRKRIADEVVVSGDSAASQYAQRENKWLVRYVGANEKTYTLEIPTPDLTLLNLEGDAADLANNAVSTFVEAFEAYVLDEAGGAVTVTRIDFVGRNL